MMTKGPEQLLGCDNLGVVFVSDMTYSIMCRMGRKTLHTHSEFSFKNV